MMRITVEIVPCGREDRAYCKGVLTVVNDLSHPARPDMGNYSTRLTGRGRKPRQGRVTGFPRKSRGAWNLALEALRATVGRTT